MTKQSYRSFSCSSFLWLLLLLVANSSTNATTLQQNNQRYLFSPNSPGRCDQNTVTVLGDCYSVDRLLCQFHYPDGCVRLTGAFAYYNSFQGEREDYLTVDIVASYRCSDNDAVNDSCRVEVDGQVCDSCSISEENILTFDKPCSNLNRIFPERTQEITLTRSSDSYLKLEYRKDRCLHPAVPSSTCSDRSSVGTLGSTTCYAVDRQVCEYQYLHDSCTEIVASYDYYSKDNSDLLSVNVKASSGCKERKGWDDCWIQVEGRYCRTCSFEADSKTISFSDCSNIPGVFEVGAQSISLASSLTFIRLQQPEDDPSCEHPVGAAVPNRGKTDTGSDETKNLRGALGAQDELVLTVAEHYIFIFVPGKTIGEPDIESNAGLTERTAEFFRDVLRKEYHGDFHSLELGNIEAKYNSEDGTFHLDFEATVKFASKLDISNRQLARLISKGSTLNGFVEAIRYTNQGEPNGPFFYVSKVQAKVVGTESIIKRPANE